jgi:hypothetical protein
MQIINDFRIKVATLLLTILANEDRNVIIAHQIQTKSYPKVEEVKEQVGRLQGAISSLSGGNDGDTQV